MQQDLTRGSITAKLVGMAGFIGIGLVFQTLYFIVDLYFVAGLGAAAIAGVGLAGNAFFLSLALAQMVGVGALSLIARSIGRCAGAGSVGLANRTRRMTNAHANASKARLPRAARRILLSGTATLLEHPIMRLSADLYHHRALG